jgi:transcriptional regulator with XRE-family HTH domain
MTIELSIAGAGDVIRAERERRGHSLRNVASHMGCDRGLLSKYENNQVGLSIEVINKIAEAIGERPEALACKCLKAAYPVLGAPKSRAAKLFADLLEHLESA